VRLPPPLLRPPPDLELPLFKTGEGVRGRRRAGSSDDNPTNQHCGLIVESKNGISKRQFTNENIADKATRSVKWVKINVKSGE